METTGKPSLVFLSPVAWQEEMHPRGTERGWAVAAGENALHPPRGLRDVPLGRWDRGRRCVCAGLQRPLRFLWFTVLEKWKAPRSFRVQISRRAPSASQGGFVGMWAKLRRSSAVKHHFFPSLFLSLFQIPTLRFLSFLQRQLPRSSLGFKVPKITKVKIN